MQHLSNFPSFERLDIGLEKHYTSRIARKIKRKRIATEIVPFDFSLDYTPVSLHVFCVYRKGPDWDFF